MNVFRMLTVRLTADTSGLDTGLAASLSRFRGTATQMARSMDQVGQSMQRVGQTMALRVTAPITAMGAAVLKTAGDFEYAMNRVGALSGATGGLLDRLRQKAMEMGATTAFTATDAANALGFMSMAGMRAEDQLGALPGVLTLAASAGLDMATAADIVTNVLAGMGMQVEELGHLNDVLVRTFTRTNTSLTQLGDAMKYVAPVAAAARVSVEDVAAAIGLMGNAGIQGSMAGTSLRSAISRLLAPTDQIREAMAAAHVEVKRFDDGSLDLIGTLREFEPHAKNVSLLMTVFGQRAGPGIAAILGQGTEALEAFVLELELAEGTAKRIQGATMQGFRGSLASLQSAVEALGLAIAASGLLEWATEMANQGANLARAMAGLNPELLKAASTFSMIAAAIPLVVLAVGGLIRALGFVLGALAGPAGLLALIAGVVIGGPIFTDLAASVRGANDAMERHRDLLQDARGAMLDFANATGEARDQMRELAAARLDDMRLAMVEAMQRADEAERLDEENSGFWGGAGQAWNELIGQPSYRTRALEARAGADALQREYMSNLGSFLDADFAPQLRAAYQEAWNAYTAARDAAGGSFTAEQRRAWLEANPGHADALRRGGQLNRTAMVADVEYDPAANGAVTDDRPLPSEQRRNTMAAMERMRDLAPETSDALRRLQEIEEEYIASVERGETVERADVEAWVDRRRAIQDEIDARVEWGDAVEQTARHIEAQERLTAAAEQGEAVYRKTALALQIMAQNEHLTFEQAMQLADAQDHVNQRTQAALTRMQRYADMMRGIGDAFASAFERAVLKGEKVSGVLKALGQDIIMLVARAVLLQPIADWIANIGKGAQGSGGGGGGGGGFDWMGLVGSIISGIFGGFGGGGSYAATSTQPGGVGTFSGWFANGGFIEPGKWGYTGEKGIERVYGGRTGATVVPMSGEAPNFTYAPVYNITGTAEEIALVKRMIGNDRQQFERKVRSTVGNMNSRGRAWSP